MQHTDQQSDLIPHNNGRLLSHELASLNALISHMAYLNKVSVYVVREMLKTHLVIQDVMEMPREAFDDAIIFLISAPIKLLLN